MLDRLNFFDIYGYLIPGLALAMAIGGHAAFSLGVKPNLGIAAALAVIIFAYIIGIVIQSIAEDALPTTRHFAGIENRGLRPSTYVLLKDGYLSSAVIKRLFAKIKTQHQIDLQVDSRKPHDEKAINDAFQICRSKLIHEGKSRYVEQFQAMYTLRRGLAIAFLTSSIVLSAHSAHALSTSTEIRAATSEFGVLNWTCVALALSSAGFVVFLQYRQVLQMRGFHEAPEHRKQLGFWKNFCLGVQSWCPILKRRLWFLYPFPCAIAGVNFSLLSNTSPSETCVIAAFGALTFVIGLRMRVAHIQFAEHFAKTVYRDYLALPEVTE